MLMMWTCSLYELYVYVVDKECGYLIIEEEVGFPVITLVEKLIFVYTNKLEYLWTSLLETKSVFVCISLVAV